MFSRLTLGLVVAQVGFFLVASNFVLGGAIVARKIAQFSEDDDVASLEFSPDSANAVGTFVTLHIHIWKWADGPQIEQTFDKPPVVLDYTSKDGIRSSLDGRLLAVSHGLAPRRMAGRDTGVRREDRRGSSRHRGSARRRNLFSNCINARRGMSRSELRLG